MNAANLPGSVSENLNAVPTTTERDTASSKKPELPARRSVIRVAMSPEAEDGEA